MTKFKGTNISEWTSIRYSPPLASDGEYLSTRGWSYQPTCTHSVTSLYTGSLAKAFYVNRNVLEGLIREITNAGKNKKIRHTIRTMAFIIRINPKLNSIGT